MAHSHGSMTDAEMAEMLLDPSEETPKYALAAVYFLSATIGFFGIGNMVHRLRTSKRFGQSTRMSPLYRRPVALARFFSSTQHRILNCNFPVLGAGLLMLAFFFFIIIWSLAVWPYYRSRWNVGSPPLAMRTGFFALGVFPFIFAFSAKWNIVSFVTGVSHERLQVYHQWLSQLFLVLSMLHTFPFVVLGLKEIRPDTGGRSQLAWSWDNRVYYWSGTAALIILVWLCWGSLWFVRKLSYEIFKLLHIISAILFSAFFYIHCNALLGSWDYFYATIALYGASIVARFAWMAYQNGRRIPRAQLDMLPGNMVRVTIKCAPHISWKVGQHYFLNFMTCSPFESHPFTIANRCADVAGEDRDMIILVKAVDGLTRKLSSLAERGITSSVPVLLDGPYGHSHASLAIYDRVLLVAGGSGISFTLAMLQDLIKKRVDEKEESVCKRVDFVWAVSSEDAIAWARTELEASLASVPDDFLSVQIHVTDESKSASPSVLDEKEESTNKNEIEVISGHGRPNLRAVVDDFCKGKGTVGIGCCGPNTLAYDVRNAVAKCQLEIADGWGCDEIYLHTEAYSW